MANRKNSLNTASLDQIVHVLRSAAEDVQMAQKELDGATAEYHARLTELSIQALNAPIFAVKGEENTKRAALNDRERELAIEMVCQSDARFCELRAEVEVCQRVARFAKDHQENWRVIAQLMISQFK
jgi:hypothetical protein